jgi:hypothetical protein
MMHEEGSDEVVENEGKDNNYEFDEGGMNRVRGDY